MMREQKLVLTSCDAIRHGPPVAYEDEQHRQGPGVLWRMGNLGANAASDLAITMIVNSMSREGLNTAWVTVTTTTLTAWS